MRILADYYLHHVNPFIFRIGPFGPIPAFGPRYYGVAYLLGFLCAYILMKKLSRDGMLRLRPALVADLVLNACIFGVLVGGRLGFVLFYDLPSALHDGRTPMLWDFSSAFPFWGALRVWDGGMSAHGGIIFTILALWWLSRKYKAPFINVGDAACMVVPIGLFFGRIANFINGELYGHVTNVPWAVKFPSEIFAPTNGTQTLSDQSLGAIRDGIAQAIFQNENIVSASEAQSFLSHHPDMQKSLELVFGTLHLANDNVQLQAARDQIATTLHAFPGKLMDSDIGAWWQAGHTALTDAMAPVLSANLPPRHPSQLYEALLEGVLLFLICWIIGRRWKKDGMASGAFLTFYPVMRIVGEQFRIGDTAVNGALGAGIIYSVPVFIAGVIYWAWFIRHSKLNVWQPTPSAKEPKPKDA